MQMAKPGKFHRKLDAMLGDWSGDEVMHPTPWDPEGGKAKGRYKVKPIADGHGIVQEYVQKRGGKQSYSGHGVIGYDAQQKRYLWHWSDSMGGVPSTVTTGEWKGNKLVFQHGHEQGHSRYTYVFHRDGSIGFSIEFSQDGAQWAPFMAGRYTKKGA